MDLRFNIVSNIRIGLERYSYMSDLKFKIRNKLGLSIYGDLTAPQILYYLCV